MQPVAFALFDFDGTLCRGDSILPYVIYAVMRGVAPKRQMGYAMKGYASYLMDHRRDAEAKEATLSFIKGRHQRELDDLARDFFRERLQRRFFAAGMEEMHRLKEAGKRIVVISASPDVYMRVLPELLPVDAVLATRCEQDEQGYYTGRIAANCKGEEKLRRLRTYLLDNKLMLDRTTSYAYGDSISDRPILLLTDHPTLVNPCRKLQALLPTARCVQWRASGEKK